RPAKRQTAPRLWPSARNGAVEIGLVVVDEDRLWQLKRAEILFGSSQPFCKRVVLAGKLLIGLSVAFSERTNVLAIRRPVDGETAFETHLSSPSCLRARFDKRETRSCPSGRRTNRLTPRLGDSS